MKLHVDTGGDGPDLVMLHGWGLHGGYFEPLMESLQARFRVHRVDLPGHGRSRGTVLDGLDAWVEAVATVVPRKATWLGWSLGGLVALRAALRADIAVAGLVLVASTPRFTTAEDWSHAQAPETLGRFASDLGSDFRRTVGDFLVLQSLGDDHAREHIRQLKPLLFAHGEPDPRGLEAGLYILRDADLRGELPRIEASALLIAGKQDRLTPPAAMAAMAERMKSARLEVLPGTAHTPFLTDPSAFAARIVEFAHG